MKLYYGGFGDYNEFVVADSEEQAVLKVGIKINAPFLPIKVTEIAEVDGYIVQIANTTFTEKPIEAEEVEISQIETETTTNSINSSTTETETVEKEDTKVEIKVDTKLDNGGVDNRFKKS